jgi:hypothetical protein
VNARHRFAAKDLPVGRRKRVLPAGIGGGQKKEAHRFSLRAKRKKMRPEKGSDYATRAMLSPGYFG